MATNTTNRTIQVIDARTQTAQNYPGEVSLKTSRLRLVLPITVHSRDDFHVDIYIDEEGLQMLFSDAIEVLPHVTNKFAVRPRR